MSKDYRAERNDEVPIVPAGVRKKTLRSFFQEFNFYPYNIVPEHSKV